MSTEINAAASAPAQVVEPANATSAPATKAARPVIAWKPYQRVLFRIAFIFLLIMSIPASAEWYKNLIGINWLHLHYRDLYDIARFSPSIYRFSNPAYNLLGYIDWVEALAIGIVGGLIWMALDNKTKSYDTLYYWLRVIVRYRAGIGIIGFGFTKLLPVQLPYPSLGVLNTYYGDLTAQKIYWLSIGIVPWYEIFAGVVEVAAGALLFFRRTTLLGAILLFGALGDITFVNFSYDGGVHVYASYFVLFSAFLIIYDVPKLYNLLILERYTIPVNFYPDLSKGWVKYARVSLKSVTIFLFLIVFFYLQYINFRYDPYKQPATSGVKVLRGNYNVSDFKINNKDLPYNPTDSVRWSEVTFENWSTLTYKVNKPVSLDLSNGGGAPMRDINRTFELTGVAGGQRVFYYDADTVNHTLYLQDKNIMASGRRNKRGGKGKNAGAKKQKHDNQNWIPKEALANIRNENTAINKIAQSTRRTHGIADELKDTHKRDHMILSYSTTDGSHVILTGINAHKDSIYVVLDRINKPYALSHSPMQAGSY
jgi:hypothetical protein